MLVDNINNINLFFSKINKHDVKSVKTINMTLDNNPSMTIGEVVKCKQIKIKKPNKFNIFNLFKCFKNMKSNKNRDDYKIVNFNSNKNKNKNRDKDRNKDEYKIVKEKKNNYKIVNFTNNNINDVILLLDTINKHKTRVFTVSPFILQRVCEIIVFNNLKLEHQPLIINIKNEFTEMCSLKFINTVFDKSIINYKYNIIDFDDIRRDFNKNDTVVAFKDFYNENYMMIDCKYKDNCYIKNINVKNDLHLGNIVDLINLDNIITKINKQINNQIISYKFIIHNNRYKLIYVTIIKHGSYNKNIIKKILYEIYGEVTLLNVKMIRHDYNKIFKVIEKI